MLTAHLHQRKVASYFLEKNQKQRVILQAPTGSGKFFAGLLPFLNAIQFNRAFPRKCLYMVPTRGLTHQFHDKAVKAVTQMGMQNQIKVSIQTGDRQDDRQLEGNLIFATIDQILSSFLMAPYSLSPRKGNVNAGAILSSYLVFDEFHLFDPHSTLPTTLHMLKMLKGITPFLLMTATFGAEMLNNLKEELDADIVGLALDEREAFKLLPSQKKTRTYHTITDSMSVEEILALHTGRTLVICNTVSRAQQIYRQLKSSATSTKVLLLHSRFLQDDRQQIEDVIRQKFSEGNEEGDYIVVSTQAIEVGVDITSTVLHTELAPANAIVQRAGRCARYQGDVGHVYIYKSALNNDETIDLIENHMPYQGQREIIENTWKKFESCNAQSLTYDDELTIIDAAHQLQDQRIIDTLKASRRQHREDMYAVMRGDNNISPKSLVREVFSQPVTIHSDPDEVAKDPFAYPSFALHPGSVQSLLDDWIDRRNHTSQIHLIRLNKSEDDAQANQDDRYEPVAIEHPSQGFMVPLIVAHPDLATYDPDEGFVADAGGNWQAESAGEFVADSRPHYAGYKLETYETHIELVYQEFLKFWSEAQWAAHRLEQCFSWAPGSVTRAAQLAVLLHDVGKLSENWQAWAHRYQQALYDAGLIEDKPDPNAAYAHTDTNPQDDRFREIERRIKPARPWHAVEGAVSVWDVVNEALNDNKELTVAVCSAIARHHTADSKTHQPYRLKHTTAKHIENTAVLADLELDFSQLFGIDEVIKPEDHYAEDCIANLESSIPYQYIAPEYLAYALIVRHLRRADSAGTAKGRS